MRLTVIVSVDSGGFVLDARVARDANLVHRHSGLICISARLFLCQMDGTGIESPLQEGN